MAYLKLLIKHIVIFSIGIFLFINSSCEDNPVYPYNVKEKYFIGIVIDEDGNAIDAVDFHYIFYLDKNLYIDEVCIPYSLKTPKEISLRINNKHNTVIAEYSWIAEQPGAHIFKLSLANFTNGIYMYEIEGKNSSSKDIIASGSFIVFNKEFYEMIGRNPVIRTNKYGIFQLTYSDLGIGEKFSMFINDKYEELCNADSIDIILYKENYNPHIESFKINLNETIRKTFVLFKNQ